MPDDTKLHPEALSSSSKSTRSALESVGLLRIWNKMLTTAVRAFSNAAGFVGLEVFSEGPHYYRQEDIEQCSPFFPSQRPFMRRVGVLFADSSRNYMSKFMDDARGPYGLWAR